MSQTLRQSERRAFGRRETCLHGMARMAGRAPEPCIVRDFSDSGARIEFNGAVEPPTSFRLMIEAKGFDAECFVRRRMGNAVGVSFAGTANGRDLGDTIQVPAGPASDTGTDAPPVATAEIVRPNLGRRVVVAVPGHEMRSKLFG